MSPPVSSVLRGNALTGVRKDRTIQGNAHPDDQTRGLRRLIEDDGPRGLRGDLVNRTRNILTALIAAEGMGGVQWPPGWRIHQLAGDRAGAWSISVSGNWRITFEIQGGEIVHLDLEDYH